ncbi:transcription initiation factor TFIID subunit 7 [Tribolium castaneum]|uniref:Transcription initiation factor TFIID subunit 7-like Protein n=1 Tax=Tribolium castaneum TaxID=7070 RepID=D6WF61_TRICA|nr:PREDICTED: transcription initiation factor TFIID subunit 7 [Tribolium castaneum]EFA00911.1 Transcription initiation factor TFIID subunit 7-like Protein [Tribolium castaneum]|eukprot:XP_968514.1 PREDICTED: transcription initiation factor TFIID subunit 7 [Tribolium castaneum]
MYKGGHEPDSPAELECQFILRLPEEPARVLREAIRNNSTLKDRVAIKIENDMRHGEVRIDHWLLPAKVMDLPTIIESLKTIDSKGFYKTADICQMLICKEEDDQTTTDEESPQKSKRKDPNKVEKKYLMPHGITPPTKNVRKRRFRKTLKKKYVEAPEIEKEVKRLLRIDNDAVSVKWEVINEDDENKVNKGTVVKKEPAEAPNQNVAEHDIFGGAVSDSEEEDAHLNVLELDDNSQNSAEDSHLTDSNSMMINTANSKLLTEFTSDMFNEMQNSPSLMQEMDYYQQSSSNISYTEQNLSKSNILARLEELQLELDNLKMRRQHQEMEIENIENLALRQRFQNILDRLLQEQIEKEQEKYGLEELLKQHPE